ncbi:S8 family serine peptidase [Zhihengliuella halotolerans]|uniref:S8 family serine peptidase n=1 Tax=Zhihengliuella halotolerans TaxID=370736 RepID=UPI0013EE59C4|nr:S8 family serine peptidase [Zhihengliuella halotolerans]
MTLINGDTIFVSTSSDGHPTAIVPSGRDYFTRIVNEDLYVFPADAQGFLASGQLDSELFNVTGLIRQGYADADSDSLPLIMQGATSAVARTAGIDVVTTLDSIDATALTLGKDTAARSYQQLVDAKVFSSDSEKKIWLDARVEPSEVDLDPATGVAQAGAEEAWDLGFNGQGTKVAVLDTGYDADHPDLTDQVTDTKDFTGEGIEDGQGHGTHVASTISGAGAADPSKTGMAPESELLIGKVLGTNGGQTSWIIAGMEWAVEQEADVVNMSLGSSQPTDCTDPMSLASEELSTQSQTLFVVAAGNSGARETVSAPGCAEGVLTVGAVDSEGAPAAFSSRGATLGGHNIKPDLAAPGVEILGAKAGGAEGDAYVKMSGTSMAAPHVAGAAALLRQAHPDYSAQQLKSALVSSAKPDASGDVYTSGSGELWTPDAITTELTSDVSVELGDFDWPHGKFQRSTEQVTYNNTSEAPIKLKLKVEDLTGADGQKVPAHLIKLGAGQITVPANGSASVEVTASGDAKNLREGAYGEIGARIVATQIGDKETRAVTSVGFWLEPKTVDVTFKSIDRNGDNAVRGYLDLTDMHQPARTMNYFSGEDLTLRVRAGDYVVSSFIGTQGGGGADSYAYVGDPEMSLTEDTTVVLDARETTRVELAGDRPMQIRSGSLGFDRSWDDKWRLAASYVAGSATELYVSPTDKVKYGTFSFGTYLRAFDPAVSTADSSYVYNLAFTEEDRVSRDQLHEVPDSALGLVSESWHAQSSGPWNSQDWTRVMPEEAGADPFFTAVSSPLTSPMKRTAYYSADIPWQQLAQSGQINQFPEIWFDPVRRYKAGSDSIVDWFKLPTNTGMAMTASGEPSRVAERQGNLVGFSFPQWKDSEVGRVGLGGLADVGNLSIYENGVLLDSFSTPSGASQLALESSKVTAVVDQRRLRRDNYWDLGLRTSTSFSFDSQAPAGDEVVPLPIALPRLDAEVDDFNRAPSEAEYPVSVNLQGQNGYNPGGIAAMTARVNYENLQGADDLLVEDSTWSEAKVIEQDGRWKVLVDNSAAVNGFVTLRLTIEDANGTTIDQTIEHLYGVDD